MEEKNTLNVIKRDGSVQEFDINKALSSFDKVYANGLKRESTPELREQLEQVLTKKFLNKRLVKKVNNGVEEVSVEDIQDAVRDFLMKKDPEAAESFVIYREQRSNYRESNTKLARNIKTKLFAKNIVNQNANIDEASFSGRIGEAASAVCKDYALKNSMSKMARKNHENNMIYQHDLDQYSVGSHNCLSDPLDDSLNDGITTRQSDIRPASSLNTAFQLTAVNFQIQSLQQFGGISATHLDWTMVPFFRISFFKHYVDGLKYIKKLSDKKINEFTEQFGIKYDPYKFGHKSHEIGYIEDQTKVTDNDSELDNELEEAFKDNSLFQKLMKMISF